MPRLTRSARRRRAPLCAARQALRRGGSRAAWQRAVALFYFAFFASEVCVYPYVNPYLRSEGLTERQIGFLGAARPWVSVPASFLWSMLADYFGIHRSLMLVLMVSANMLRACLPLSSAFGAVFAVIITSSCLSNPITIMADVAVTVRCTEEGEYGRHRVWGAVGWGAMSTVAGVVLGNFGIWSAFVMSAILLVPAAVSGWFLWRSDPAVAGAAADARPGLHRDHSISKLAARFVEQEMVVVPCGMTLDEQQNLAHRKHVLDPSRHVPAPDVIDVPAPVSEHRTADAGGLPLKGASKLAAIFGRQDALQFFYIAIVMGVGFGLIESYLFLLLTDMGAPEMLLGLSLTVTCIAEVPVFQLLTWMMTKLGGPDGLLNICLGAYVVRMLIYSQLPRLGSPYWVLPVECLHGLTFGAGWGAGCEKSKALAPPGLEATQQGVFQGLYFGLGYGLGSLVGGVLADEYGYQTMYLLGALIVSVLWACGVAWHVVLSRRSRGAEALRYAAVPPVDQG